MSTADILHSEITSAPEPVLVETLHFLQFLKAQAAMPNRPAEPHPQLAQSIASQGDLISPIETLWEAAS